MGDVRPKGYKRMYCAQMKMGCNRMQLIQIRTQPRSRGVRPRWKEERSMRIESMNHRQIKFGGIPHLVPAVGAGKNWVVGPLFLDRQIYDHPEDFLVKEFLPLQNSSERVIFQGFKDVQGITSFYFRQCHRLRHGFGHVPRMKKPVEPPRPLETPGSAGGVSTPSLDPEEHLRCFPFDFIILQTWKTTWNSLTANLMVNCQYPFFQTVLLSILTFGSLDHGPVMTDDLFQGRHPHRHWCEAHPILAPMWVCLQIGTPTFANLIGKLWFHWKWGYPHFMIYPCRWFFSMYLWADFEDRQHHF